MQDISHKVQSVIHSLYTRTHVSHDLAMLYTSRTLMRISLGTLGVFLPVFFFKEFGSDLQVIISIYLSIFGLYLLLLPITARLLATIGTRRMLLLGVLFVTFAITALYYFPENPLYATIAYIAFSAIYKSLYWLPFHVDFAHSLDKRMRGRQLAILRNIASVVLILVPVIGGFIITAYGFSTIFVFSIVIMLISMVPLWFMNNAYERYSWGFGETFKHLFARVNRTLFLANAANGAQGVVLAIFWPIYMFMLLDERYTALGIVVSLTIIVVIIFRTIVGRLFDTWSHKRMLVFGVIMATTGWIVKIFVQTPFEVFAANSYHSFGSSVNALSFDATTYEQSADNGRYIDEYTALKEMSLSIGRLVMLLFVAVLIHFFSLKMIFIVAAFVALFMIVLNKGAKVR